MYRTLVALALAVAPMAALQAQHMPVSTFLPKAEGVQKKGPLGLLTADFKLLMREIESSASQLRSEQAAAVAAGKKPNTCWPAKAPVTSDDILKHFRSIPGCSTKCERGKRLHKLGAEEISLPRLIRRSL